MWAVEGCQGVGRHLAQRLVADGERVVDVPAKLSARVRVFSTGQGRKTDATAAHSVAVAGLRSPGLRTVAADDTTVALRLLVDRRDELGAARTDTVNRLHRLLLELIDGGAKKFLSATQARALLASVRPRDLVGRTRRQLAAELIVDLTGIDKKIAVAGDDSGPATSNFPFAAALDSSRSRLLVGGTEQNGRFSDRDYLVVALDLG